MSLKPLPARKIIKLLSILEFRIVRKRGSHVVLKHSDGRITGVPVHAGERARARERAGFEPKTNGDVSRNPLFFYLWLETRKLVLTLAAAPSLRQ